MALANGVLVHGPTAWGCAVRLPDGRLEVAAERKKLRAADVRRPLLRGPARLVEAFAVLPAVKRALPAAQLPFERPGVAAAMVGSAFAAHGLRRSALRPAARELAGAVLSLAPALLARRSAERAPARHRPAAKAAAAAGALAAATEIFGWMTRHPEHPLARALARPGHELQQRVGTDEPTPEQLEVADAALRACLRLEDAHDHDT